MLNLSVLVAQHRYKFEYVATNSNGQLPNSQVPVSSLVGCSGFKTTEILKFDFGPKRGSNSHPSAARTLSDYRLASLGHPCRLCHRGLYRRLPAQKRYHRISLPSWAQRADVLYVICREMVEENSKHYQTPPNPTKPRQRNKWGNKVQSLAMDMIRLNTLQNTIHLSWKLIVDNRPIFSHRKVKTMVNLYDLSTLWSLLSPESGRDNHPNSGCRYSK